MRRAQGVPLPPRPTCQGPGLISEATQMLRSERAQDPLREGYDKEEPLPFTEGDQILSNSTFGLG